MTSTSTSSTTATSNIMSDHIIRNIALNFQRTPLWGQKNVRTSGCLNHYSVGRALSFSTLKKVRRKRHNFRTSDRLRHLGEELGFQDELCICPQLDRRTRIVIWAEWTNIIYHTNSRFLSKGYPSLCCKNACQQRGCNSSYASAGHTDTWDGFGLKFGSWKLGSMVGNWTKNLYIRFPISRLE